MGWMLMSERDLRQIAHSQDKPSLEQTSLSQSLPIADGPGLSV